MLGLAPKPKLELNLTVTEHAASEFVEISHDSIFLAGK